MHNPDFGRRRVLQTIALSSLFAKSSIAQTITTPINPDVIIVGAGAAGLAAAKTLLNQNISCLILEADNRIGGRAYTDTSIFGVPYDMGCHWLHNYQENPWVAYAQENGFDAYAEPHDYEDINLFDGNKKLSSSDVTEFNRAVHKIEEGIYGPAEDAIDISAADSIKDIKTPWKQLVENWDGAWDMGKDFDSFSGIDWYNSPFTSNYFCKQGFGALVAHYGKNLPVQLNTSVTSINWNGDGVKVTTNKGSLTCKKIIITVSTGILASGNISFTPALPVDKQESFHKISMGNYNHIALQFKRDIFGLGDDAFVLYKTDSEKATGFITNISGTNLSFGFVGGRFGWELESEGIEAAVNFGVGELVKIYGSDIKKDFIKGYFTQWGKNPFTLGSYASAEPGYMYLRKALREPVGDKLFFAGEATHRRLWATCGGARLTGEDVGKKVAKLLVKV